jgi:hypothetical protein
MTLAVNKSTPSSALPFSATAGRSVLEMRVAGVVDGGRITRSASQTPLSQWALWCSSVSVQHQWTNS